MATKIGGTWYTEDAEYTVLGDRIVRGDGSYCVSDADADDIARQLADGELCR